MKWEKNANFFVCNSQQKIGSLYEMAHFKSAFARLFKKLFLFLLTKSNCNNVSMAMGGGERTSRPVGLWVTAITCTQLGCSCILIRFICTMASTWVLHLNVYWRDPSSIACCYETIMFGRVTHMLDMLQCGCALCLPHSHSVTSS